MPGTTCNEPPCRGFSRGGKTSDINHQILIVCSSNSNRFLSSPVSKMQALIHAPTYMSIPSSCWRTAPRHPKGMSPMHLSRSRKAGRVGLIKVHHLVGALNGPRSLTKPLYAADRKKFLSTKYCYTYPIYLFIAPVRPQIVCVDSC